MWIRIHWFSTIGAGRLPAISINARNDFPQVSIRFMAKKKTVSENPSATKAATKKTPAKDEKGFEESLWDSANRLRGSVESSEYKHVVLSLIFLKFVSDKFEERKVTLIAEGKQAYTDIVEFYTMQNGESDRGNDRAIQMQDLRSMLRFGRDVCAVAEVCDS